MILTDEPYLNEPAWAESSGTPQSMACKILFELKPCLAYSDVLSLKDSANVRRMVVQTAVSLDSSLQFL